MRMPFGKHEGDEVADLPDTYLIWLVENCHLYGLLRAAVRAELRCRGFEPEDYEPRSQRQPPPPPPPPPPVNGIHVPPGEKELFTDLMNAGFRALAMRHHPDHGGNAETMRRLNTLVESVRRQLQKGE